MENIMILKKGDIELKITTRPSVQQMDQFSILKRKFDNYVFWDIVFTLETIKLLLIDKTKTIEIDDILKKEVDVEIASIVWEWAWQVIEIFEKVAEAKKKLPK